MNPLISRHCRQILVVLFLLILVPGVAQAVTVKELGVSPTEIVNISTKIYTTPTSFYTWTGNVYAGINKLSVNGHPRDGFCIDPFHFSLATSSAYSFEPLSGAPKSPGGPMGLSEATLIERLWGSYYSPTMSAANAAGLQIAIWDIVGGPLGFQLNGVNDYGASGFLAYVEAPGYTGPLAYLIALTGPGQDYVVAPDGGTTVGMLGLAFMLLAIARWRSTRQQALALGKTLANGSDLS